MAKAQINSNTEVEVTWEDGKTSRYHPIWLRYHCRCWECKEEHSGMRKIPVMAMPTKLTLASAKIDDGCLKVTCQESDHVITQPLDWLREFSYAQEDLTDKSSRRDVSTEMSSPKEFLYEDLLEKEEMFGKFLEAMDEQGLALINDLPDDEDAVKNIAEKIAPVYKTLYGETFSVVAKENPYNIAYLQVPLEFHQDLPYYESPPGLQFLHCFKLDNQVEGGANVFVDCFHVANQLKDEYPEYFETLLKVPATFQKIHVANDKPFHMVFQRPHITVNKEGKVNGVFWNVQAEGPLQVPENQVDAYYKAYFKFAELMDKSPSAITHRLHQGQAVAFNNRRLVHNRLVYKLNGGRRHLRGCYINVDDFRSAIHIQYLKNKKGQLPKRIGNQCNF